LSPGVQEQLKQHSENPSQKGKRKGERGEGIGKGEGGKERKGREGNRTERRKA
jgi:hypothetical protein